MPATLGAMAALRFPGRTALIDERGTLTCAELEEHAASLATALRSRMGDGRVGVLCRNHRGFVETVLAASRLGNDIVLLNTDFSAAQLGQVAEREGIELLVHDQEFTATVDAPGTAGRPSYRLTVKVLGEDGRELPPGETGEIYTGGGLRFAGYTGGGGKHVLRGLTGTGDLGHFDAAGRLFIGGRADDMIVSGGENVFPGEVEDLLGGHPDVAEVSVTGVDGEQFGRRLAARVVRKAGSAVTEDDLKEYVRGHLARYKVPREVRFVRELPRTGTGKVRTGAPPG